MSVSIASSAKSEISLDRKSVSIFNLRYSKFCKNQHLQPLRSLKLQVANSSLRIIGDRIKYIEWIPLLRAISLDKNLHYIALKSKLPPGTVVLQHVNSEKLAKELKKGSVLFTKFMLNKVVEAFSECIVQSRALMCLQFHSIPLHQEAMSILAQAVSKTQCLQHLSLQNCDIGNKGCELLLHALKNRPSVVTLDLSNCNISSQGAYYMAELIKVQEIARFGECWRHSLRYREVSHEIFPGLRRISLNNNPNIGDTGLENIVFVLCDDYWIKAMDMQNCGITDKGCALVINLIKMNNEIVVFDVRRNPISDPDKMTEIISILCSNASPDDRSEYGWLKIDADSSSSSSLSTVSSNSSCCQSPCYNSPKYKYKKNGNLGYISQSTTTIYEAKKKLCTAVHSSCGF